MGRALYRSYRPKKLSEVVGQKHVTTALERALAKGAISHAYLFTGPRGTGKTSIARILAHEINGLPYEDDATHLDIIEIDAASNRRIDEIRELRDKVHVAPTSARYKVYIIDEVHMLTKEAFNALLKTLEEPPAHVVFMLATTEVHKLPETIISRTQRYALKPIEQPSVIAQLRMIADAEKINISDEALALVAQQGEGSMRDSTSLLDQVRNSGEEVGLAEVQAVLGIAPQELLERIQAGLAAHDITAVAEALQQIRVQGFQPVQVARQMGELLRAGLLAGKPALPNDMLMTLLTKLIEVPASSDPQSYLEVILLDIALSGSAPGASAKPTAPIATSTTKVMSESVQTKSPVQIEPHPSSLRRTSQAAPAPTPAVTVASPAPTPAPKPHSSEPLDDASETSAPASDATLDATVWPQILGAIKQTHNTLFSIINATQPRFEPGKITLLCAYAFHQKRLNEPRNKKILADVIQQISGHNLQISCVVSEGLEVEPTQPVAPSLPPEGDEVVHHVAAPEKTQPPQSEAVAAISNIFGGGELLES